ncbi:RdgB/HAM1 family non-canonical purine NTP pyrophosphatase [Spirochaetota bacterium]
MKFDTVVLATQNKHKIKEITHYLKGITKNYLNLSCVDGLPEIIENGDTFFENALIKAKAVYEHTKIPSLAEDSGLVVPALNNEPGVRSARYAGEHATREALISKLLTNMKNLRNEKRNAYFQTTFVFYASAESTPVNIESEGRVYGRIALSPRGSNGFGYDPVFIPDGHTRTFAEMTLQEKNSMSHRGKALAGLLKKFEDGKISEYP